MARASAAKRILTASLVAAALAAAAYALVSAGLPFGGDGSGDAPAAQLQQDASTQAAVNPASIAAIEYEPDSYRRVAEDGKLELLVNDAGHIRVIDKLGGGYVWQSDPGTAKEPDLRGLWKSNADSPFMLDYVDMSRQTTGVLLNTANLSDAKTKTTVAIADGRAELTFHLQTLDIEFKMLVGLQDGYVEVAVPEASIVERSGKQIVSIWPFPFFGAAQKADINEDGYMLVPLRMGAIVPMKADGQLLSRVSAKLYGGDRAIPAPEGSSGLFPAFGMKRDDHSFVAVIAEGDYTSTIHATPAGLYTSFHWVAPQFVYRNEYFRQTSKLGAGYKTVEKTRSTENRRIRYYFQSGERASYAGMAADYRGYLMETEGLSKLKPDSERLPLLLTLYGGAEEKGLFSPSFVPATTFEQGSEVLRGLHEAGVGPIRVIYNGWASGGDDGVLPDVLPAEKKLGGDQGLTAFVREAQRQGDSVYLQADYTRSRRNDSFVVSRDAMKDINNKAQIGKRLGEEEYVNPASVALRLLEQHIDSYKSLGIDGLLLSGLGELNSDYRKNHYASRADSAADYRKLLALAKERLGSVATSVGSGYLLGGGDFIRTLPIGPSYDLVATRSVPFLPMALHGLVDYAGGWGNMREIGTSEWLRSIEFGAVPYYLLTYEDPMLLRRTAGDFIWSSRYDEWKTTIAAEYKRWEEALGPVRGEWMTDHRQLAPGVYETRYENGVSIVVNYNDTAYSGGGISVPALNFAVFNGWEG